MLALYFILCLGRAEILSDKLTEVTQQILVTKDPIERKILMVHHEEIAGQLQKEIDILATK